MSYGSNLYRKDNPRWTISNATVTPRGMNAAFLLLPAVGGLWDHPVTPTRNRFTGAADRVRGSCGICVAWLIGLPRRAGMKLHAMNDAEARWWHWDVRECRGGLVRQYRDARFPALAANPGLRREGLDPEPAQPGAA